MPRITPIILCVSVNKEIAATMSSKTRIVAVWRPVFSCKSSPLEFHSSKRLQLLAQLLVGQFAALCLLFQLLRFGNSGVPIIRADLASLLSRLQPVVDFCIFLSWRGGGTLLCFLPVRAHLMAGAFCFARRNIVAVTGVVSCCQQKISSAVVAATWSVARHQPAVKIRIQEMREI